MILVFGGTTEGRIAVQTLDAAGSPFFYSTKGSLQEIEMCNGKRLCGAMDAGRAFEFCRDNGVKLIVDAAHPFAIGVHDTVHAVSQELDIPVIRYERESESSDDNIIWCSSYQDAVSRLFNDGITSLLALTGVNTIPQLKEWWSADGNVCHFRVLDRDESRELAAKAGFPQERLLFFREDYAGLEAESEMLERLSPQAIITKDSGASGYFNEKVEAAKACGVKVYAVRRPQLPEEFITVYGPVGLRLEVEKLAPGFFPLRIGLTTGSTATAAVRGALRCLLHGEANSSVYVVLPQGERVRMPLKGSGLTEDGAWGSATKYGGDDPDATSGYDIMANVRINDTGEVRFFAGEGVGTVTLPGLGLEVGGAAINNGPRNMMRRVVEEELPGRGADITISVPGGRELAARTFNPRVGVSGGISIIGTSGVVRPFSKEAFLESISREMDVAKALGVEHLIINSGAKSEQKLKERVGAGLPPQAFIHYGNFIGDTVRMASEHGFRKVTLGIMIGKAVKLAAGNLDTHSRVVTVDKEFVKAIAHKCGCSFLLDNFTLARELWGAFEGEDAARFFGAVVELCRQQCAPLLPEGELEVILVDE